MTRTFEFNHHRLFSEGGEVGEILYSLDWSDTHLGGIANWSLSLKCLLSNILNSPASIIFLLGEEGIAIYNNSFSKFAGSYHPGLLGSSFEKEWPESSQLFKEILKINLNGLTTNHKKLPLVSSRNQKVEEIWVNLDCSPLWDEFGKVLGSQIILTDITEQVKTENALKESEEQLRFVVEGTHGGMWVLDLETNTSVWNDRAYEIYGYSKEEVGTPGMNFIDTILHPEDLPKVKAAFEETLKKGTIYDIEYRVKHKCGKFININGKGKPVYNKEGKITKIAGITLDITPRKQTEENLIESEARFSSIFSQTSVGIAQADLTGRFTLVNDRYCQIVGRSKEELYHLTLFDITHPEDLNQNLPLIEKTINGGPPFKLDKRYIKPDGSQVWVNINVSVIKDAENRPIHILGVCHDITDQKHAEAALIESESRFKTIADFSPSLIWMMDEFKNITYVNKTFLSLVEAKESENFSLEQYVYKDDLSFYNNNLILLLKIKKPSEANTVS